MTHSIERIMGPRVELRPVTEADMPHFRRWAVDPEAQYWWDLDPHDDAELRKEFLEGDDYNPAFRYVVELRGRPVGYVQWYYPYPDPDYRWSAGIDIVLGEGDSRDRGVGTEVIRTLLQYLFEVRGLHRVTIDPETSNARAIRCYEKAGFRFDGILRHDDFMRGEYVDTYFMSILEDEWPAAKARWEAEGSASSGAR